MGLVYHKNREEKLTKNTSDPWKVSVYGLGFEREQTIELPRMTGLFDGLTDEDIAAYLDGDANAELTQRVLSAAARNEHLARMLQTAAVIDEDVLAMKREGRLKDLPLTALAASEPGAGPECGLHCELFVMRRRGLDIDETALRTRATQHGWLSDGGMRIGDVGNLLESEGLSVVKEFNLELKDIAHALLDSKDVIAVVDGGELTGDREAERLEDQFVGEIPDHAVVVTAVDLQAEKVEVYDPQSTNDRDVYEAEQFLDAWEDSCRYALIIG